MWPVRIGVCRDVVGAGLCARPPVMCPMVDGDRPLRDDRTVVWRSEKPLLKTLTEKERVVWYINRLGKRLGKKTLFGMNKVFFVV